MKQFSSIKKIDSGILYALELISNISALLPGFGFIASMANVLTKGSVLSDSSFSSETEAKAEEIVIALSLSYRLCENT